METLLRTVKQSLTLLSAKLTVNYFDHKATTPIAPDVLEPLSLKWVSKRPLLPSSRQWRHRDSKSHE
jgi:hypothetical protein